MFMQDVNALIRRQNIATVTVTGMIWPATSHPRQSALDASPQKSMYHHAPTTHQLVQIRSNKIYVHINDIYVYIHTLTYYMSFVQALDRVPTSVAGLSIGKCTAIGAAATFRKPLLTISFRFDPIVVETKIERVFTAILTREPVLMNPKNEIRGEENCTREFEH